MVQNIIVAVIILTALAYTAWSVYQSVRPGKIAQNACGGCTGCDLKNIQNNCELTSKNSTLEMNKVAYPTRKKRSGRK